MLQGLPGTPDGLVEPVQEISAGNKGMMERPLASRWDSCFVVFCFSYSHNLEASQIACAWYTLENEVQRLSRAGINGKFQLVLVKVG